MSSIGRKIVCNSPDVNEQKPVTRQQKQQYPSPAHGHHRTTPNQAMQSHEKGE